MQKNRNKRLHGGEKNSFKRGRLVGIRPAPPPAEMVERNRIGGAAVACSRQWLKMELSIGRVVPLPRHTGDRNFEVL